MVWGVPLNFGWAIKGFSTDSLSINWYIGFVLKIGLIEVAQECIGESGDVDNNSGD